MTLRPLVLDALGTAPSGLGLWLRWVRNVDPRRRGQVGGIREHGERGETEAPGSARAVDGCPLCVGDAEALERALGEARAALSTPDVSVSICSSHLRILASRVSADEARVLARAILDQALACLDLLLGSGQPRRGSAAGVCGVCLALRSQREAAIAAVLSRIAALDHAAAVRLARSLCMPHLVQVLQCAEGPVLRLLAEKRCDQLAVLRAELGEFFRKSDYRFAQEPKGAEQTAWLRVFALLGGPPARGAAPAQQLWDGQQDR